MSRGFTWALVVIGFLVVTMCAGFSIFAELAFYMIAGCGLFLARVAKQVSVDWSTLGLALTALALFTAGTHAFLRWLVQARAARTEKEVATEPLRPWSFRWTVALVAIIVAMFVAGVSTVGITHQLAWLARSPDPVIEAGARTAAHRMQSSNNLKQIVLGALNHESARKHFPAGFTVDDYGRLLHGWQTQLLPFVEYGKLYDRIDHQRPWDDPVNATAFRQEVGAYAFPGRLRRENEYPEGEGGYALSGYAANVRVMGGTEGNATKKMSDGASNTILSGEAVVARKPWGSPTNWRDPAAGIALEPGRFGSNWSTPGAQFAYADGHVGFVSSDVDPKVLRALATPDGDDEVDSENR